MTDKLKKCPFCGGEADTEWHHGYFGVRCNGCGAEVTADGMNDAIYKWNKRKPLEILKWWLDTNTEKGVVYIPEFVVENIVKGVQNE